jgi:signal transduction histidine kinase
MCIIIAASLIFFLPLIIFTGIPLFARITILAGFWIVCCLAIYNAAKRLVNSIIEWIDDAYQSEKAFINNASHELNNPLTAIQGECEISLLKERSVAEYQSALHRIAGETARIIQLMRHLIFLSKGENEILRAESEPIILAEFIMHRLTGDRIIFYTDNFALIINANSDLLKTALTNIIGNALKYSEGEVEIRLRSDMLEICDRGIGVPADEIDRVFQPFYRATNTRGYAGNGIGLSLSIHILRAYGAIVSISSSHEEGTRVKIDFQDVARF